MSSWPKGPEHSPGAAEPLEVWGGAEYTVNRVRDSFIDQTRLTRHHDRLTDLDLFAGLGISRLRHPVLWERVAPDGLSHADWSWTDERLGRLQCLGIKPIVGLVHHGSGPRDTNLLDPAFPAKLAAFARAVAERYPWVEDWTPVNEPVTTARFSALYGVWYPHATSSPLFVQALINQCRGIALSMQAIRQINPRARLIQTEDCGHVRSTPVLAYQARFENLRQRAGFDLLTGRISRGHPLWRFLVAQGATPSQLEWFCEHPTPPDIIGINYYVTSDRYLDHRVDVYPVCTHGGNGRHRYADTEAARVDGVGIEGHLGTLRRLWQQYRLPMAVTEVHLGGGRDDQLRWLAEAWSATNQARAEGLAVQAVTVWSLLGAYGWDQLVSTPEGRYESGVFDLRSDPPRPTALASLIKAMSAGEADSPAIAHPVLRTPGWWRRPDAILYRPGSDASAIGAEGAPDTQLRDTSGASNVVSLADSLSSGTACARDEHPRVRVTGLTPVGPTSMGGSEPSHHALPLLITGGDRPLGQALARIARARGLPTEMLNADSAWLTDGADLERLFERHQPWAVINAAGYMHVDDAEREPEQCWRDNVAGPVSLALICRRFGIPLLTFSSDFVFDGRSDRPYEEHDQPRPLGVYGRTQWEAELRIFEVLPQALVIRSAALFGPWDHATFVHQVLQTLAHGATFHAADNLVVSPTYIPDLVNAALDLLIDGEAGIWHVANGGALSWADLARRTATHAGYSPALIQAHPYQRLGLTALRPPFSPLATRRGQLLRPVDDALRACLHDRDGGATGRLPALAQQAFS